jgi:hypothetical protein
VAEPDRINEWSCSYRQVTYDLRSRDSVVGIANGYRLDDRGVRVRVPAGQRIFSSPQLSYSSVSLQPGRGAVPGPRLIEKKNLPDRDLTKVEDH